MTTDTVTIYREIPPDMALYGGRVEWGVAAPGGTFYDLAGCTVRLGVNAVCSCVFYGANGIPVPSLTVVNVRADGRGEIQQTDASGRVSFMFGPGSAWTPSDGTPPPLKIFAVDGAVRDDESKIVTWGAALSDAVLVGDTNGLHTEWSVQFVLHPPVVVVPPVPPPDPLLPTIANDDELRFYCLKHAYSGGIDYMPDAAMTKRAHIMLWGAPIGNEFRYLNSAGVRMAGQAFMLRIATCEEGDWPNIIGVLW